MTTRWYEEGRFSFADTTAATLRDELRLVGPVRKTCLSDPVSVADYRRNAATVYVRLWQHDPSTRPTWYLWLQACMGIPGLQLCELTKDELVRVIDLCRAARKEQLRRAKR